jgi:hypothetical protein
VQLARRLTLLAILALPALPGCGGDDERSDQRPFTPSAGGDPGRVVVTPGLPELATKNTTRVASSDTATVAAAVALAVHPSATAETRPGAVALVEQANWAAAISAAQLAGAGVRAPVLFASGDQLPEVTRAALARLRPAGVARLRGAQVIRIATAARVAGLGETVVEGANAAALADAIDALHSRATGRTGDAVVVAALDEPALAMPAAGWAAKSGDPVLWAGRDDLPRETVAAIRRRDRPRIAVLGPEDAIGPAVMRRLDALGDAERIVGSDAVSGAIAFARFRSGSFGWGVVDPGHGLVMASPDRPADAAAAAPLSAAGSYGPLLLLGGSDVPPALGEYLLDIRPGYESDPVRGVYNHAWLIGDATTISFPTQSRIDSLLEIQRVDSEP